MWGREVLRYEKADGDVHEGVAMTPTEALEYIKSRYPNQQEIWGDYLKGRGIMKIEKDKPQ